MDVERGRDESEVSGNHVKQMTIELKGRGSRYVFIEAELVVRRFVFEDKIFENTVVPIYLLNKPFLERLPVGLQLQQLLLEECTLRAESFLQLDPLKMVE